MSEKLKFDKSLFPKIVFKNDGTYEIQLSETEKIEKLPFKSLTINDFFVEFIVEDILDVHNDEDYSPYKDYYTSPRCIKHECGKRPYRVEKEE